MSHDKMTEAADRLTAQIIDSLSCPLVSKKKKLQKKRKNEHKRLAVPFFFPIFADVEQKGKRQWQTRGH